MTERQEAPHRLLTSLSSVPAVQRKCAGCAREENEVRMPVQPRLEVGPVDDPYEREADDIADRVMAMREPPPASAAGATVQRASAEMPELMEDDTETPRMRAMAETTSATGGVVQRACAACSSKSEEVQRAPADFSELTQDDEQMPRMRATPGGGGEHISASAHQLTSGGAALSKQTRSFFETRMGRNLSDVRVHRGTEADALNQSISSRAFTFRNHIWLSRAEAETPSETMAHELAHVLQQTRPGPLGETTGASDDGGSAPQTVRRISIVDDTLYFAPSNRSHDWAHDRAIRDVTDRHHDVLGELRVPNANRAGHTNNRRNFGFADLVHAPDRRLWGLGFESVTPRSEPWHWYYAGRETPLRPVGLDYWGRNMFRNGRHVSARSANGLYRRQSAPFWRNRDFQRDATDAPASYEIGDMKFVGDHARTRGAREQTDNYAAGFNFAKNKYNEIVDRNNAIVRGSNTEPRRGQSRHGELPRTTFSASRMSSRIGDNGFIELSERVELKLFAYNEGRYLRVGGRGGGPTFPGKGYYRQHPTHRFVWEYVYWPDRPGEQDDPSSRRLRRSQLTEASTALYEQMTRMPTGNRVRRLPLAKASAAPSRVMRNGRRPLPPRRDPFVTNYAGWRREQATFTRRFRGYADLDRGTGRREVANLAFDTAIENTVSALGGIAPQGRAPRQDIAALHRAQREFGYAELIEGRSGRVLGQVRKTFGQTFIKALNIYVRLRTKFQQFMERGRRARSFGSAKARAIMKAGGVIIGTIIRVLLPQVGAYLVQCVEEGFNTMFRDFLGQDFSDWTEATEQAFIERYEEIAGRIEELIESTAERIKTRYGEIYESVMDHWESTRTLINIANHVINIARLAACVAGGLETVGIACVVAGADYILGLFGVSPTDHLLGWLLGSCPAQAFVAEFILGRAIIRNLPREIAETIRHNVKDTLPPEVSGLICDSLGEVPDLPNASDIPCDDLDNPGRGGSGSDLSQAPSGVPASVLNRRPTAREVREQGRLSRTTVPEESRRLLEPEEPPPPGTPEVRDPPPRERTGATAEEPPPRSEEATEPSGEPAGVTAQELPPASEAATERSRERAGGRQRIRPGQIEGPTRRVRHVITIYPILGGNFEGFRLGSYPDEVSYRVRIRLRVIGEEGMVFGPHEISINPSRVFDSAELGEGLGGYTLITFETDQDYVMENGDIQYGLRATEHTALLTQVRRD